MTTTYSEETRLHTDRDIPAPSAVTAIVVALGPSDIYRSGRTLRALGNAGIRALDCTRGGTLSLDSTCSAAGAVWILRAGTWPRDPQRIRFPAGSQTGRHLLALGATLSVPDSSCESEGARAWRDIHAGSGGDLSAIIQSGREFPAPIESAYLGQDMTTDVLAAVKNGELPALLKSMIKRPSVRCIRFAPLDVFNDERLRVTEVITSLQRGGAERVVIDLDADGKIVGIDIQHASEMAALSRIDLRRLNVSALSRVDVPVRELVAGPAM